MHRHRTGTAATWHMLGAGVFACLAVSSCDRAGPGTASRPANDVPPGVVRLAGSPEEIGTRHGTILGESVRLMIREYVGTEMDDPESRARAIGRVRVMKPSLPEWYRRELSACAKAAGVDEDVLLYAQCEGDIKSLGGCTSYVAFGPATHDGKMEIGRNFDYWGIESADKCAVILNVVPRPEDGYAFVSVGWAGILGGWTFFNEKGLFVANNIGGFNEKNPQGVPTLILERIIAQKAATVEEAVALIRSISRMRGQALVIGQAGPHGGGGSQSAAVVLYDGVQVQASIATNGFAFHTSTGTDAGRLQEMLRMHNRKPMDTIRSAGTYITLHSVAIWPESRALWVAHGRKPSAHLGEYVRCDLNVLLKPQQLIPRNAEPSPRPSR